MPNVFSVKGKSLATDLTSKIFWPLLPKGSRLRQATRCEKTAVQANAGRNNWKNKTEINCTPLAYPERHTHKRKGIQAFHSFIHGQQLDHLTN